MTARRQSPKTTLREVGIRESREALAMNLSY